MEIGCGQRYEYGTQGKVRIETKMGKRRKSRIGTGNVRTLLRTGNMGELARGRNI